ncbi:MAG: type I methionyl aminopeptidase [Candidatus Kerfeldbacteria bacterium RIFCSPHIGHO2_02_FULL_42_14]|uniref:Methionine aminopeptidase n=1 Tax=Candidatus Kerfeldbacteria bacterium RIFCSPHIGHO2_02_FULL_42_14 TaxID=1798540 RepID=A0A1G2ASY9_9BACT|nr:MAG: type I methionyl aminopeptidase [Candidatus Kerfeldbacteria bacterium RIFCSPHIGHO2_02_FULL_42_14]OGY80409.1 MAG: type I methionyl aminopeptidase [Candidatus Kerfeldbacteria bacterium RIFCSPHIGHO2_12_FULL_42_13]OGY83839.1 MAG: type I methionyl aminopeptidase [Candidatus Kerfeldbacteria bacterium RIFCSPLOWO2_02_FULL_42_19]OGY85316.1 MAG: type I methionyl aminopeptidase [Candidatus Kerfeldbacteria bacterium RIFCSPLOWO2_12_FULL_43_9]
MIRLKTKAQIQLLRENGKRLAYILSQVQQSVATGISTYELDQKAEKEIHAQGGTPSFKGYKGFPASICVSVNEEVVHGIPTKEKILKSGDIVGLDIGMWYDGLCTDMAITLGVGKISKTAKKLLVTTQRALTQAILKAKLGNTIGDIGACVQKYAEARGFGVVRDLVGHGVGYAVHESPQVPNFVGQNADMKLAEGMVLAIEPMLTCGSYEVEVLEDGWTVVTKDDSFAAQFEHTIAITKQGPLILTAGETHDSI